MVVDEATAKPRAALTFAVMPSDLRQASERADLSAAKAYLLAASDDTCTVSLPVSYTYAVNITIVDERQKAASCGVAKSVAAAAATELALPGDVRAEPVWDPCTVQERLPADYVGDEQERNCMGARVVRFSYAAMPRSTHRSGKVGEHPVAILDSGSRCEVVWRLGPAPGTHAAGPDLLATVRQPDCATALEVTTLVTKVVAGPPPTDVAPQQPLLYKPNEKDVP